MKYRQKPEHFIVEEIAEHKLLNEGAYKLYSLKKENEETFVCLNNFCRENNIPRKEIGIAGIKDTHALTTQYVSIPSKYSFNNKQFKFLGFVEKPIKLGDLIGNKFIITVNEVSEDELKKMNEQVKTISNGVINYFDSQRFGSVIDKKFIAKFLIQKDYESAVKQYLTSYSEFESQRIKAEKNLIKKHWKNFDCNLKINEYRLIINEYKKTKKWIFAYKRISPQLREMFISSYQSYLWNECVKELITKEFFEITYSVGTLKFLKNKIELPDVFATISNKMIPKEYEKNIINKVLLKENLELKDFNIRQTGNFFKSNDRKIIFVPKNFKINKIEKIDKKYCVVVEFELPKGSYATMVLKKLFGK
ncbi:MAG: tRNA pseudouridine(13) synthase TruD [Candidatus Woesearchaeota archaeon]